MASQDSKKSRDPVSKDPFDDVSSDEESGFNGIEICDQEPSNVNWVQKLIARGYSFASKDALIHETCERIKKAGLPDFYCNLPARPESAQAVQAALMLACASLQDPLTIYVQKWDAEAISYRFWVVMKDRSLDIRVICWDIFCRVECEGHMGTEGRFLRQDVAVNFTNRCKKFLQDCIPESRKKGEASGRNSSSNGSGLACQVFRTLVPWTAAVDLAVFLSAAKEADHLAAFSAAAVRFMESDAKVKAIRSGTAPHEPPPELVQMKKTRDCLEALESIVHGTQIPGNISGLRSSKKRRTKK